MKSHAERRISYHAGLGHKVDVCLQELHVEKLEKPPLKVAPTALAQRTRHRRHILARVKDINSTASTTVVA